KRAEHHQLALREIDGFGGLVDQHEAERDQAIDATLRDAADQDLRQLHLLPRTLAPRASRRARLIWRGSVWVAYAADNSHLYEARSLVNVDRPSSCFVQVACLASAAMAAPSTRTAPRLAGTGTRERPPATRPAGNGSEANRRAEIV